jgi:hypothetical protein
MKELRKIKKELSKELYGKSWEELQKWMQEEKKRLAEKNKDIVNKKIEA